MKPIVSFDMDMTLLNHADMKITSSAMEAIERLRENYIIVIATGRDMDSHYSVQYRDQVKADAVIHTNGTKITVGEQTIFQSCMGRELLESLLSFADKENMAIGATLGDEDYYTHPEIVTNHDLSRWGECGRQYFDPWKLLDMEVPSLCYIGSPDGAKKIETSFPELRLPLFAGKQGADIIEKKNSKANGLRRLCQYFGTTMEKAYAFGDSMNDFEIIQAVGTGIAMGNADPVLKKAADYVTDDIDHDGVYKACVHFGLIG